MSFLMSFLLLLNLGYSNEQQEAKKIDFSFKKASVKTIVEKYAKESGEKFIFNEANIKNNLTIVSTEKVTIPEAYTPKFETVEELLKISTQLISSNSSVNITENKKLIITDWLSNLKKIDKVLAEVDQKKKTR